MSFNKLKFLYLSAILLIFGCKQSKEKKIPDEAVIHDSYELVKDWPNLPQSLVLGTPTGIGINEENNIVVFHRAGRSWMYPPPEEKIENNAILTIDSKTGEVLKNWGAGIFLMPHGLEVDRDNNIWVTDTGLQQILKFSQDGELLHVIGEERKVGRDSIHFALPTDVACAPDASFYVGDGYWNSRVIKYSNDNSFMFEWGKNGPKRRSNKGINEGEFNIPHSLDLDNNMNVYVADRENNRIQKFDSLGNFVAQWRNKTAHQLYAVAIDHKNNHLLAVDYDSIAKASNIFRFDLDLKLNMQFNNPNTKYHDIAIDDEGTIYVADMRDDIIQKFQLIKIE